MIGRLRFADRVIASLDDSGSWTCPERHIERVLNRVFGPHDTAPAGESLGVWQLQGAADWLGADVEFLESTQSTSLSDLCRFV